MSIFGKDRLFHGLFSTAGIISAEKYKIYEEIKKTKEREKGQFFHDSFLPDKEWKESLEKKEIIKPSDIIRGCKFNIDELKTEIKQQNLYFKDDFPKIKKIKNIKKYINLRNNKSNPRKKNPLINKKYKYHNLHMKRIEKYKNEGIYEKILNQQESIYYPKLDFVYKRIESGPKWEKLSGRGLLFEPDIKKYNSINIYSYNYDEQQKSIKNKNKEIGKNKSLNNIKSKLYKGRNITKNNIKNKLVKYSNIMTKSTCTFSKMNLLNKYNNKPTNSNSDNYNYNNSTIFTQKKLKKTMPENPDLTQYDMNKCKSVIDFGKYMDYEKLEKKKKRNQQIYRIKNILNPNYSSVESNIKMFVKYNHINNNMKTQNKKVKNKTINFEGINSNELLYDANYTFEKIYGNKLRAVPLFHKMMARPNDINLPSYMKGLYSRMGLYLTNEKTLQMNNYENAKMYKFDGDFTPKKNKNNTMRKFLFDEECDNDKNKIEKDLELMKKKFKNILFNAYE